MLERRRPQTLRPRQPSFWRQRRTRLPEHCSAPPRTPRGERSSLDRPSGPVWEWNGSEACSVDENGGCHVSTYLSVSEAVENTHEIRSRFSSLPVLRLLVLLYPSHLVCLLFTKELVQQPGGGGGGDRGDDGAHGCGQKRCFDGLGSGNVNTLMNGVFMNELHQQPLCIPPYSFVNLPRYHLQTNS